MRREWKWMLMPAALLLLAVATSPAQEVETPSGGELSTGDAVSSMAVRDLLGLKVGRTGPSGVEITLAAVGEAPYETLVLDSPDRLVLDLRGVVSRLDRYRYPVEQDGVLRVRAAQRDLEPVPVTRIVFDLQGPPAYDVARRGADLIVTLGSDGARAAGTAEPQPRTSEGGDADVVAELVQELESRFEPEPAPAAVEAEVEPYPSRAVEPDLIDRLLAEPVALATPTPAPDPQSGEALPQSFETQRIVVDEVIYSGKPISLNLVDADIKQVFRLFHEISGLNFVLDPSVSGRVTIVLDNVPWDQALDIILKNNALDKLLENNVIRIASTQKLAQEASSRRQLREAKELEVDPITITRALSYARAQDVDRIIRDAGVLTSRGRVFFDERTNTVIISDIPKKTAPLDALISTLDAETPQVMIEARIVETSRDFVQDLGVVWGFTARADASTGTSTGLSFPHNASVKYGLNLPGEGGASNLAFKFGNVIDSFTLDVALNALETEGYGRVLSSPKIATQNNEEAEIEQGLRIPVTNTTATEISVEFVSASLKMQVTPQITAEKTIILDVLVENNSPDFVNTSGGIPSIRTQRAQTKVLINDGGTTVIGGIFTVNEGKSEIGVPWFRKLPIFGWLFKAQNTTNQNRELLIFITPKIMRLS